MSHFTYPCFIGVQGGQKIITIQVPFSHVERLLVCDNTGHVLERSQRERSMKRVNDFAKYLLDAVEHDKPFIVPPLIGNCDGELQIDLWGETFLGQVTFPMEARTVLFDGQHRQGGIVQAVKCDPRLATHKVTIVLTQNLDLPTRQQFFSDINSNASKPSASINLAYNRSNEVSQLVKEVISSHPLLLKKTDFERPVVTGKINNYYVSYKAVCDATSRFIAFLSDDDAETIESKLFSIWSAWVKFSHLGQGTEIAYASYKSWFVTFHAVSIVGFGFAMKILLERNSLTEVIAMLENMKSDTCNAQSDYFEHENWKGICVNPDTGNIIATVKAQKAVGLKLAATIQSGSFS
ncbi:DNA sulfur modification protein DndB [Pantoea eucalypti]|uniref:DNA sulfur modification protein DndB n=1 Tax=Pantoea eucalypti TaxID=470933 RepID=UPI003EE6A4C0